ncbi:MAG TPA: type II toxin-antitoxin system RelE/ParE family toxin [Lacipirellulaceae bacterium]|nr:type II toxin-antitoxin system RelE/ParE family toxin [Lacipirellulaceae bacterium]
MGRVLRTPQALEDLDDLWSYIARDSLAAADRMIDQLYERFVLLSNNTELGERQPRLADGAYRRFVFRNYVIYYVPDEAGVTIVRVLHGARDERDLL